MQGEPQTCRYSTVCFIIVSARVLASGSLQQGVASYLQRCVGALALDLHSGLRYIVSHCYPRYSVTTFKL